MADDFRLTPQEPDTRSRCPDCRGAGALRLLDTDPTSPTEALMGGERWDYCPRCFATGYAVPPRCACGSLAGSPGALCYFCASREASGG